MTAWQDEASEGDVPELLTPAEVALILRCHKNTVYARIRRYFASQGTEGIPAKRVGARLYVPRQELEKELGIKILRIPPRSAPESRGGGKPRTKNSLPAHGDGGPSHTARPRSGRVRRAPIGYVERLVAQWRIRR